MQRKARLTALAVPGVLAAGISIVTSLPSPAAAVPRVGWAAAPARPKPAPTRRTTPSPKVTAAKVRSVPLTDPAVVSVLAAGSGYRLAGSAGGMYSFGVPDGKGPALKGHKLGGPIVASLPAGRTGGVRLVGSDGGVYASAGVPFYGSAAGHRLQSRIVGAAANPVTGGYWLAGADGGVFAFHAGFYGSAARIHLNSPIVGMAATPSGRGYWLVAGDGGVFAFGDARYFGSAPAGLRSRIAGITAAPSGRGYWLAGRDGGIFSFGNVGYYGSASQKHLNAPVVAVAAEPSGRGYWLATATGGVLGFGSAHYYGSAYVPPKPKPRKVAPAHPAPAAHVVAKAPAVHGEAHRVVAASIEGPGAYRPGSTGLDLSQYQCGRIPARPSEIAIVQVTGGRLNSAPNPCYAAQARWAGRQLSSYIYLNGLPDPAPAESMDGRAGHCTPNEGGCQAYNFGWNWSRHWVDYSRREGVNPSLWWLDVERGSGWSSTVINDLVIRGAVDGLRSEHVSIGIYSTPYQWSAIAGSLTYPGIPVWVPGAGNLKGGAGTAQAYCAAGQAFAGGHLQLVQWGYTGSFPGAYSGPPTPYDQDYACPR